MPNMFCIKILLGGDIDAMKFYYKKMSTQLTEINVKKKKSFSIIYNVFIHLCHWSKYNKKKTPYLNVFYESAIVCKKLPLVWNFL